MNLSIYDLAIPSFINSLTALSNILNKAKTHAESKKTDINAFLQSRLIADQFPLSKQIQITCDNAKFFASRLSGIEAPKHPDTETTLEEFQDRIKSTLAFLQTITSENFNGWENRTQSFQWYPGKHITAHDFITKYAIPNFYFHLTTAYSILRANGVDVGKTDFIGHIDWKDN